jgi:hypothetical protein
MLETAETRSRDLARSAEAIWRERRRLIDDMRGIGEQLVAIGDVEASASPSSPTRSPWQPPTQEKPAADYCRPPARLPRLIRRKTNLRNRVHLASGEITTAEETWV